jgi:hypothetical protein
LGDAADFVAGEIVANDQIAWLQFRAENLLEVGPKEDAV